MGSATRGHPDAKGVDFCSTWTFNFPVEKIHFLNSYSVGLVLACRWALVT